MNSRSQKAHQAIVTVRLSQPAADDARAFEEIQRLLALAPGEIDDSYGAMALGEGEYIVRVQTEAALRRNLAGHSQITGVIPDRRTGPPGAYYRPPRRGGPRPF